MEKLDLGLKGKRMLILERKGDRKKLRNPSILYTNDGTEMLSKLVCNKLIRSGAKNVVFICLYCTAPTNILTINISLIISRFL